MGKIILEVKDGRISDFKAEGDVGISLDTAIAFSLGLMDNACKGYLKKRKEDAEDLYDKLDALFYRFMCEVFPNVQPREFDLSDAALLMAQDQVIEAAAKKGITYEEALEKYEKRAKEYVRQKAKVMA